MAKINPLPFYGEWAGHPLSSLSIVLASIRSSRPGRPVVYLAGDSSLDSKAWINSSGPGGEPLPVEVPAVYKNFLEPPTPKPDVAFWLNHFLGSKASVLNSAVEASLLRERETNLLAHDEFIRDNITSRDVLIVSVGANDIALSPSTGTMKNMLQLAWLSSKSSIEAGSAGSLAHFRHMFGDQTKDYIDRLIAKQKPKAVVVCMIYFPLEAVAGKQESWADAQLQMLGYGSWPGQLQAAIRRIFQDATMNIKIDGTKVVPCPLYEAMNGKTLAEYVARVEPSVEGGKKMAELLAKKLDGII